MTDRVQNDFFILLKVNKESMRYKINIAFLKELVCMEKAKIGNLQ